MKLENIDIEKLSPMMRQYVEIKKQNKDVIILFRLGDFYEMFFEDAITVSREQCVEYHIMHQIYI